MNHETINNDLSHAGAQIVLSIDHCKEIRKKIEWILIQRDGTSK